MKYGRMRVEMDRMILNASDPKSVVFDVKLLNTNCPGNGRSMALRFVASREDLMALYLATRKALLEPVAHVEEIAPAHQEDEVPPEGIEI